VRFDDSTGFETNPDAVDERALMGQRLGARDEAVYAILMRGGEDFFGGKIGDAVDAVVSSCAAAEPQIAVGEADAQVGSRRFEVQRGKALLVHEVSPAMQLGIVSLPGGDGVGRIHSCHRENSVPQACYRDGFRLSRKNGLGPGGRGTGHDRPIDAMANDEIKRRLHGFRLGHVGAGGAVRINAGQKVRVGSRDGEPCGPAAIGRGDAGFEPVGGTVEGLLASIAKPAECCFFVGEQRCHQRGSGAISLGGNGARERDCGDGSGHDQLLALGQVDANADCELGEAVELLLPDCIEIV
jgi:hypothetical protein